MLDLRRRQFITLLGGAAAAWPLAARAQQTQRRAIGVLGTATPAGWSLWTAAFAQRLRELGWIESRNVVVEYRWAEGKEERFAEIAAELVRMKVDVIVTSGGGVRPAMQATSFIPIVFGVANDPVGSGFVASLARPGGNVTGLSNQQVDVAGKRFEILREVVPGLRRIAVMGNSGNVSIAREMSEIQAFARSQGVDASVAEIRHARDIAPAIVALKDRTDALYVAADPLVIANRLRISTFALAARLPTIMTARDQIEAGGLISYGSNIPDLWRRAAELVDKILRGAKPGDLPVEQPTKFDLIINLITAEALGLTIPPTLLARADEVIE
jgi:putative tryptophan/tyrosine transport system substrate-binding protein